MTAWIGAGIGSCVDGPVMCRRERFGRSLRSEVQDRTFSMGTMRCSDRMSDARVRLRVDHEREELVLGDLGFGQDDRGPGAGECDL